MVFLGDVVGRAGRVAIGHWGPRLKRALKPDLIVTNGENAAGGFGITEKIVHELFEAGTDVITTGNHVWDQKDILPVIDREERLIRPLNYPSELPGKGWVIATTQTGHRVLVINAMGRLFMDPLDDPFRMVSAVLDDHPLGTAVDAVLIDFHAEATSEKMAFGHYFDGRASLIVGTHTHVPTADCHIMVHGTAYQSDAGMCGDYDSVIGMDKVEPLNRFTRKMGSGRLEAAGGEATICGLMVDTNAEGLAGRVEPIQIGGRLQPRLPDGLSAEDLLAA
ncbi:MAG: TIGR00282 family metallophosphoesterase [Pseudomonadota bacterium]